MSSLKLQAELWETVSLSDVILDEQSTTARKVRANRELNTQWRNDAQHARKLFLTSREGLNLEEK